MLLEASLWRSAAGTCPSPLYYSVLVLSAYITCARGSNAGVLQQTPGAAAGAVDSAGGEIEAREMQLVYIS